MKLTYNVNIKHNVFKMYAVWHYTSLKLAEMYGGSGKC